MENSNSAWAAAASSSMSHLSHAHSSSIIRPDFVFDPTPWDAPHNGFTMGPILGRGSFGVVFSATANGLTASTLPVAVKLLRPPRSLPEAQQLEEEAQVHRYLTTLKCDAIMPLQSAHNFKSSGQRMLVMPLADGGTLLDLLLRDGPLSETAACATTKRIVTALAAMHEAGVIHRDVSAKNIVIDSRTGARLCDFGLAWDLTRPDVRDRSRPIGTPESCAPEIFGRHGSPRIYSAAGDIYALGVLAVNALAGYAPFRMERKCAEWPSGERQVFENDIPTQFRSLAWGSVWHKVSAEAKDLILRCLDKNPDKRPTANQLLNHPWLSPMTPKTFVPSDHRFNSKDSNNASTLQSEDAYIEGIAMSGSIVASDGEDNECWSPRASER